MKLNFETKEEAEEYVRLLKDAKKYKNAQIVQVIEFDDGSVQYIDAETGKEVDMSDWYESNIA